MLVGTMIKTVSFHRLVVEKSAKPTIEHRGTVVSPRAEGQLATRIGQYIGDLVKRNESGGAAQSAWWDTTRPAFVQQLLQGPVTEFGQRAKDAASLLAEVTPPTARSGLIVLARDKEGPTGSMVALKLVLSDEQLARFDENASGDDTIVEERISNVLPKPSDVKKGALVPHPDGRADARVVDEQLRDPAGYWLKWLGLTARPREPVLAKLTVATVRLVVAELTGSDAKAGQAVAAALQAGTAQTKAVSPKAFSKVAATNAELSPARVWAAATEREPTLGEQRLAVTPAALNRVELVIQLDDGVVVRGPAHALAGRYRIRTAGQQWVTEIDSKRRPEVKEATKRGATRRS